MDVLMRKARERGSALGWAPQRTEQFREWVFMNGLPSDDIFTLLLRWADEGN